MEDVEKITDDTKIQDNATPEDNQLMKEWELYMHDFVPEDMSSIVIEPRQEVVRII